MAQLGSFGSLVFQVSSSKVQTYSELEESSKGRWANHEPINDKVLSEFLGPGQDQAKLVMIFSPALGVNPNEGYQALRNMARTGEHFPIILGGVPLSNLDWYVDSVESVSETFSPTDGSVLWRECSVTVKEYN